MKRNKLHKLKHSKIECPCCSKEVEWKNTTLRGETGHFFLSDGQNPFEWLKKIQDKVFTDWMCDACFYFKWKRGDVLMSDWYQQELYGFYSYGGPATPILLYQTKTISCKICKEGFEFTAGEQQFWYETARLPVEVKPNKCACCKKESKEKSEIMMKLQGLLQEVKESPSKDNYKRIVEIYIQFGNIQKAGVYQRKEKYFQQK